MKLSKKQVEGNELVLDIRKPGDLIGENLFSTEVHPVSAIAMEDCRICVFSKYDVEQLILDNPAVGLQVIRNLSDRLTSFFDRATSLAITKIEDRLYGVLRNVAQDHGITRSKGVEIQFPFTHKELAFLNGAHRVSVTRALSSLEKAGKIILENNTLTATNLHI